MKKRKLHFRYNERRAICDTKNADTTTKVDEVTCKRCLKLIVGETTTEQGELEEPELVNVVVTNTGPNFINCIKVVRNLGEMALKDAKDFCDKVRDKGPQVLMRDATNDQALLARVALASIGASVLVGPPIDLLPSIEKAYREMLALFLPSEKYVTMLDDLDDDEKSGRMPWPITDRCPRIADVRRWLEAGGGLR